MQVADNGTVFAVWLDGPNWTSKLVKSYDHGATWTEPVAIAPALRWTDHPWLAVSPDGQDVYVGLNMDDSFIVASHDGGQTFDTPIKTNTQPTPGHWWDANGAAIAPDGSVYFAVINFFLNYRGPAEINVVSSHDRGASWQTTLVDTSAPPPGCNGARVASTDFSRRRLDWRSIRMAKSCWCITRAMWQGAPTDVDHHVYRRNQLDATGQDLSAERRSRQCLSRRGGRSDGG